MKFNCLNKLRHNLNKKKKFLIVSSNFHQTFMYKIKLWIAINQIFCYFDEQILHFKT
jgi:hypothetical protein